MNAVNGTGVNRFLNPIQCVAILANGTTATGLWNHHKGVGGDVSAITTADAISLFHPNCFFTKLSTQGWFRPRTQGS